MGLAIGFTVSVFLFLFLDMADLGVAVDSSLLGAIIGGVLAGSTALIATLVTCYFLLVESVNKEKALDEAKVLSIYLKSHAARDAIVKSYRHYFDSSPGNVIGSVAQIVRDSLRDSKVLVGLHEQAHTSDLPHDELARLQFRPEAARFAADLV